MRENERVGDEVKQVTKFRGKGYEKKEVSIKFSARTAHKNEEKDIIGEAR